MGQACAYRFTKETVRLLFASDNPAGGPSRANIGGNRRRFLKEGVAMEYLVLLYRDESLEGGIDQAERGRAYEQYAAALAQAGVIRGGQKLQTSDTATSVTVRAAEPRLSHGPVVQGREQLGGYFVLECADMDDALRWAALCPGAAAGTVEVRPVSA
jgi:hypothetical protein